MSGELNKITEKLSNLTPEQIESILGNLSAFKDAIFGQLSKGEKLGLSDDVLSKGANFISEHLTNSEEPENMEQKLLHQLWNTVDDDQKQSLASMLENNAPSE